MPQALDLAQTLAQQQDINEIRNTLRTIYEVLENEDIAFLKDHYTISCSHIAMHVLAPTFSSVVSKQDIKSLIIPIIMKAPVQATQSFLNVILRLQNSNVVDTKRELVKNHIKILIDVIDQVIENSNLAEIVMHEMEICHLSIDLIASLFSTLPDRIYNAIISIVPDSSFGRLKSLIPVTFRPKNYFENISTKFCEYYALRASHANFIATILSSVARRGQTEECAYALIATTTEPSSLTSLLKLFSESVIESVLHNLIPLISAQNEHIYLQVFADLIQASQQWRHLFTYKFLLSASPFTAVYYDEQVQINIIRVIGNALIMSNETYSGENIITQTLSNVTSIWRTTNFIKQTTPSQHNYVTYIILMLLSQLKSNDLQTSNILRHLVEGVQNRLHSTLENVRRLATMVSMKFSTIIDSERTVILFEAYKDDLKQFEELLKLHKDEKQPIEQESLKKKEPAKKSIEQDEIDPDKLILQDDESSDEEEQDDEMSDTSSIESLDLEDDERDLQTVQPPQYVQSLLQMLRVNIEQDNAVEMLQVGLRYATELIRRTAADINQRGNLSLVCVALCRALLFMESDFGLNEFETLRFSGLVSLIVSCPNKAVRYLTGEFYSTNVTTSHRTIILDTLKEGALELSNRSLIQKELRANREKREQVRQMEGNEYEPIYPKNTRRWGSKRSEEVAALNRFPEYAALFFYSVLRDYDHPENAFILFGEDTYVLSRLIHTIGVLVYCCGTDSISHQLAKDVLDFIWTVQCQYHLKNKKTEAIRIIPETEQSESTNAVAVRRSILTAMMHSLNALPANVLIENVGHALLSQYLNWLLVENKEDPDEESRELAATNLSLLKAKLG